MDFYDYWIFKTNVNSKLKIKLINEYGNSEKIYEEVVNNKNMFQMNLGDYDKFIKTYNTLVDKFNINEYKEQLDKNNIKIVKFGDEAYPKKLMNIDDPPFLLFYRGNLNFANEYCISIIGTRNSSPYGEEVCKNISKELSVNNVGIVSGGARGIDILSHKICIENKGRPIAVLGSGLLNVYPKENSKYFDIISKEGCLISEYDLHTPPDRYNFPMRNRIISALGDGLIVIEAKEKSGTMITVRYALDQGKDIAAVPGPIFWEKSNGCNKLIKDGAFIISEIGDLYDIFNLKNIKNNTDINGRYSYLLEDPEKYSVYSLIKKKPISIDEIINTTGISLVDLYKILFELERLSIIESTNGNFYKLKIV